MEGHVIERNPKQHESAVFIDKLESIRRRIIAADKHCILLNVKCPTVEALFDLRASLTTNTLQTAFAETYFAKEWKDSYDIAAIDEQMTMY